MEQVGADLFHHHMEHPAALCRSHFLLKMVKICCIGIGYVGGPTMAIIALKCPSIEVAMVDISVSSIIGWNNGQLPIHEPELDDVVKSCRGKKKYCSFQWTMDSSYRRVKQFS